MKKTFLKALAVSTALTSASMAVAQVPPSPAAQATTPTADTTAVQPDAPANDDIVVTARREAENLQNVPVSVQVVTGDTLQKLSINQISEVSKLSPGLTLDGSTTSTKIVLRGVTWQPGSGTPATPLYFNEIPFDPQNTLLSIFDVGQIEVLRGPQGTTRGAPSISGAVTLTTRKPDLNDFGGYLQGQYGSGKHSDFQGAINIPIVKDVLAIRAAANIEDDQGNRVFSVRSNVAPKYRARTYRVTALFRPTDTISIEGMYQRRDQLSYTYAQVAGNGSPGAAASGISANFNGPALSVGDRKSVQDGPSINPLHVDLITLNASWEVLGHTLTYNYGRQIDNTGLILLPQDTANFLPGFEAYNTQKFVGTPFFQTHEIRLSSIRNDNRPFDYDLGWFQKSSIGTINFGAPVYLAGAFGAPGTAPGVVTTPNNRYVLQSSTNIIIGQVFDSYYGSVRAYLGSKTELTGGLSIIRDRVPVNLNVTTAAAAVVATPSFGFPCQFLGPLVSSAYAGFCDAQLPAGIGNSIENHNDKYSDALYNFSLSHKFTDDILAYATTGTSFRTGLPAINNTGLPSNLLVPKPETATSYEAGIKTSFGRRLRINAAIFQIDYKNKLTTFANVPYFNSVSGATALTSIAFYRNIDARVRGAELEIAAKPLRDLSLGVNFSYAKNTSKGGQVPCATAAAITAANPINFCTSPSGQTLNTQAPFQATANGSYDLPLSTMFDGYFRFNVNYQGANPNYGNFPDAAGKFRRTAPYAVIDLFAGLAGHKGRWDLGVYAKNVFDKQTELTRQALLNNIYAPYAGAAAGYDAVQVTLPREIGVTLRVAFGSR
uniref:TonB-dependent receptor n=1 Tax=uncultured Sphingomonas sp. TaxID=158754 RepID=UPI0035C9AD4A